MSDENRSGVADPGADPGFSSDHQASRRVASRNSAVHLDIIVTAARDGEALEQDDLDRNGSQHS